MLEAADEIGGGTRSSEAIVPGLLHDHCSAIHPMAVGSPFLTEPRPGPLRAVVAAARNRLCPPARRRQRRGAAPLGRDHRRRARLRRVAMARAVRLVVGALRRALRGHHGAAAAGAAPSADAGPVRRADRAARRRCSPGCSAPTRRVRCSAGVAAHAFRPLHYPMTSAIGLGILTAGHRHGWAVAAGGSQSITDALAALLGGSRRQDRNRHPHRGGIATAARRRDHVRPGPRRRRRTSSGIGCPRRIARAYRRFRRGPGAFKVDFAVDGGVPWTNPDARRAGTVHVVGSFAELAATERDIHAGRMPQRPFVLVGQQYLADPGRSVGDIHPVWSYAHVPNGYTGDATAGDHRPDRAVRTRIR